MLAEQVHYNATILSFIFKSGVYLTVNSKLSEIKIIKITKNPDALSIPVSQSNNNNISKNYINILLLGVDNRNPHSDPRLADFIVILTLN